MAIKRLAAIDTGDGYRFTLWLDDTKTIPDPEYVRNYDVSKKDGFGQPVDPESAWEQARESAEAEAATCATRGQALKLK